MAKSPDAFRTISEVADWLGVQAHVLRFWESKFTQVKPIKRAGGRRYYRPADMLLLGGIKKLLHDDGLTIKGVQKILREQGMSHVADQSQALDDLTMAVIEGSTASETPKAAAEPEPETVAVDDTPDDTGETLQAEASSIEAEEDVDDASAPAPEIEALLSDDAEADEAEPAPVSDPDPAPEARPEPDVTPQPAPPAAAETPPEPDPLPEEARETPEPETEEEPAPSAPVPEPETISDPEPEPIETSPEAAEGAEPAPEDPAPEEETGDAEEVDAAALPSFIRRPLAETEPEQDATPQADAAPETPPEDAAPAVQPEPETAEPEVAAGDDATAEQPAPEPAAEDAAPAEPAQLKPRIIDLPDLPVEADLPAAPSALSAVARAKSLAAKDRDAAKPLLAQLIRLRASMANPRKDTHKD
ncbi:MerR family transcriptional regulator [uncultured Roseobacter sp.]|uniref:MerR family transcriptional regulator n=1 Tax=uncultured Roseobacter sp. TaxID=114847 RepID=UPI00263510A8|nr:MerR family transcriptional regulator [uncultured Roseobacter sp.]